MSNLADQLQAALAFAGAGASAGADAGADAGAGVDVDGLLLLHPERMTIQDTNEALFIREGAPLGPRWPGVPLVTDLNTISIVRLLTVSDEELTACAATAARATGRSQHDHVRDLLRHPLSRTSELRAWKALQSLAIFLLAQLPTSLEDDAAAFEAARCFNGRVGACDSGGTDNHARHYHHHHCWCTAIAFRMDKKALLREAVASLGAAIVGSGGADGTTTATTATSVDPDFQEGSLAGLAPEFVAQAVKMPTALRKLLVDGVSADTVSPAAVFRALKLSPQLYRAARIGMEGAPSEMVHTATGVLIPAVCASLRAAVDADRTTGRDTVDGAPDHQLNLTPDALEALVGTDTMHTLATLMDEHQHQAHRERRTTEATLAAKATLWSSVRIFVRRYSEESRPWIPFHCDAALVTCNVALVSDSMLTGGKLVAVYNNSVQFIQRSEGDVTIHASTLLHAVTRMARGTRYSLIIFKEAGQ